MSSGCGEHVISGGCGSVVSGPIVHGGGHVVHSDGCALAGAPIGAPIGAPVVISEAPKEMPKAAEPKKEEPKKEEKKDEKKKES